MSARCNDHPSKEMLQGPQCGVDPLRHMWILSVMIMTSCLGCNRQPPDISNCTRIEVHYTRGALEYFIPETEDQDILLNDDERLLIKSFDTWTVTDPQLIKAFAYDVSWGTYRGKERGMHILSGVRVACYRGKERVASFTVYRRSIVTADKNRFEYSPGMPDLDILAPPEVKPLEARWKCSWHLSQLLFVGLEYRPGRVYPDPNQWCDDIVEFMRSRHVSYSFLKGTPQYPRSDACIARTFACPSVHASSEASDAHSHMAKQMVFIWRSDYAMNPHCRKESPGDMVFLFETNAGWNQHGGPELFTFDNHDPKGGCVLFNDGTVKFIRTQEELLQLRWK